MRSVDTLITYHIHNVQTLKAIFFTNGPKVATAQVLLTLQDVARWTSATQLFLLVLIMTIGTPGMYTTRHGFMYVSDNFCTKKVLSTAFILSTLPTWALLACSISLEQVKWKRTVMLILMAIPLPTGIGIVMFSVCEIPGIHYAYVNLFVGTIACIHITVGYTAKHFKFIQCYSILVFGSAICGLLFILLAMDENGKGTRRDTAVIMEYIAVTGFIVLNALSVDRIREHLNV